MKMADLLCCAGVNKYSPIKKNQGISILSVLSL